MSAYMDLTAGDRIFCIPETVVSLVVNTDLDGRHRTAVLTTRLGNTLSTRTVLLAALVHTEEGCAG